MEAKLRALGHSASYVRDLSVLMKDFEDPLHSSELPRLVMMGMARCAATHLSITDEVDDLKTLVWMG